MRVLATCDLHWGHDGDGDESTRRLAELVNGDAEADVFLIAGDIAGIDKDGYTECLALFRPFAGERLLVPGNHDLWSHETDAREILERELPRRAREAGFRDLGAEPVAVGRVGFAGSVGWYDYAFRDAGAEISDEAYAAKELDGVARWNDGRYVRWDRPDGDVARELADRLAVHLARLAPRVDMIVAAVHHVPFLEVLDRHDADAPRAETETDRRAAFVRAYMGSPLFGQVLLAEPKVRLCVCGHDHRPAEIVIAADRAGGPLRVINPGSDYRDKELTRITLPL